MHCDEIKGKNLLILLTQNEPPAKRGEQKTFWQEAKGVMRAGVVRTKKERKEPSPLPPTLLRRKRTGGKTGPKPRPSVPGKNVGSAFVVFRSFGVFRVLTEHGQHLGDFRTGRTALRTE